MWANGDDTAVEHDGVVIDKRMFADSYSIAEVAMKGRVDGWWCRYARYKFFNQGPVFRRVDSQIRQPCTYPVRLVNMLQHVFIFEVIKLLASHFLKFRHFLYKCLGKIIIIKCGAKIMQKSYWASVERIYSRFRAWGFYQKRRQYKTSLLDFAMLRCSLSLDKIMPLVI